LTSTDKAQSYVVVVVDTGALAGIAVGAVLLVVLIIVLLIVCCICLRRSVSLSNLL